MNLSAKQRTGGQQALATLLFLICAYFLTKAAVKSNTNYIAGDGVEYVLMAEALNNHLSPDIHKEDVFSYRNYVLKSWPWEQDLKHQSFDQMEAYLKEPFSVGRFEQAVVSSNSGQSLSIHFFTYPLLVVPFRRLLNWTYLHPTNIFFIANAFLILGVIFYLLFYSKFTFVRSVLYAFLFLYSAVHWYLLWTHPEVFVACFAFLGLLLYDDRYYLWGIFLTSIAATQFQPLALVVLTMVVFRLVKGGFKVKNIVGLGLSSFWVILPSIFYYYHFGVTNLVKELGYLDNKYVGLGRIYSLFLDLDQGMILSFPVLMFAYLFLVVKKGIQRIKYRDNTFSFSDFIPLLMLVIILIASTMEGWNHGQSVSNRYVVYIGTLLLFHFMVLLERLDLRPLKSRLLLIVLISTQIYTINYFGGFNTNYWGDVIRKKISAFALDHFPDWVLNEPKVFAARTLVAYKNEEELYPGVFYKNEAGAFRKAMIHEDHLDQVHIEGLDPSDLAKLVSGHFSQYGFVFFTTKDIEKAFPASKAALITRNLSSKSVAE